jgi:hypothetical protein
LIGKEDYRQHAVWVHISGKGTVDAIVIVRQLKRLLPQKKTIGPKIKFCLFPLSDQPTKIDATQKILLPHLMKNYFF